MSNEDALLGFAPVDFFFSEEVDCHKGLKNLQPLPRLAEVFGDESFADVYMGWHDTGLSFRVHVNHSDPIVVLYPDIRQGDSIEFFIDTRRVTLAKTTHRFCHHFYFLPEAFEGHMLGECTRFRTEDTHPLCPEGLLELAVKKKRAGYVAEIFIPKECLTGYDPSVFPRLGFTYRINRAQDASQHFAFSCEDLRIDAQPSLWAGISLV